MTEPAPPPTAEPTAQLPTLGAPTEQPRRPLGTTALVVGLILLGLGGLWWGREADVVPSGATVYVLPLLLIGAGIAGLVAFVLRGRGAPRTSTHPSTPDPLPEEPRA